MKLIRNLTITQKEFYDYLEAEVAKFINTAQNGTDIKGIKKGMTYSYTRENQGKNTITILDYKRYDCYVAKIETTFDTSLIRYQTIEKNDVLEVTFYHEVESLTKKRKKMIPLFRWFSEGVYYGRMSDALFAIQDDILKSKSSES